MGTSAEQQLCNRSDAETHGTAPIGVRRERGRRGHSSGAADATKTAQYPTALAPDNRPVFGLWPRPLDWPEVTDREREIFELGFMSGFFMREDEVAQANADADRYYRLAFDRHSRPRR